MDGWLTDTETSERFPLMTRANADEIGPVPFTPLTWTLAWEQGAVPGTVDAWVHLGAFHKDEFRSPVAEVYGCWGGYLYNQVSVGRVFGARAPGASPGDIDRTYFGSGDDVPPYHPDPRDEDLERTEALGVTLQTALSSDRVAYADDFAAEARRLQDERPDLDSLDDVALVARARDACATLRRAWDVYIQVVISASVAPGVVHATAAAVGRPEDAVAVFTAIGDVASAGTSLAVWNLSRQVRSSETLTAAFERGLDGLLDRLEADEPTFVERFTAFLDEHGHRGPNEYELASPTWRTEPDIVLAMIDRLRRQGDDQSPEARSAQGRAERERASARLLEAVANDAESLAMLEAAIPAGQLFYRQREAAKDALVRAVDEVRRPLRHLAARMAGRGAIASQEHLFQLLASELDDVVVYVEGWKSLLAERAGAFAGLHDRVPPRIVRHGEPVPPIDTWPRRNAAVEVEESTSWPLQGVGASPGVVSGRVRVVRDVGLVDDLEEGEILVCPYTDPSWAPLLMAAGAVVCQVGAEGSHAAVVSRELGVPCVVSVPGIMQLVETGQRLRVDGQAGTVELLPDSR